MTNGQRIRAMTDEELGKYLMMAHDCELSIPFCQDRDECFELLDKHELTNGHCLKCMLEWLKQPVKEDAGNA